MATVPTPLTGTAGTQLTASAFNTGVHDPILFLMNGYPRAHVYQTTGTAISDGGTGLVTFDSEFFDNDSMHSTSSNPGRFIFTTAGLYDVDLQVDLPSATYASTSQMIVNLNDGGSVTGGSRMRTLGFGGAAMIPHLSLRIIRLMAAGDYYSIWITQSSGASRTTVTTGSATRIVGRWIAVSDS